MTFANRNEAHVFILVTISICCFLIFEDFLLFVEQMSNKQTKNHIKLDYDNNSDLMTAIEFPSEKSQFKAENTERRNKINDLLNQETDHRKNKGRYQQKRHYDCCTPQGCKQCLINQKNCIGECCQCFRYCFCRKKSLCILLMLIIIIVITFFILRRLGLLKEINLDQI